MGSYLIYEKKILFLIKINISKIIFIKITLLRTIIVLSSNNILFSWIRLEVNFISFIPIIRKRKKISDQTIKYLIIQRSSSSIILISILINSTIESPLNCRTILIIRILIKIGIIPFHLWLPNLMQTLSWNRCLLLSTWQKIAPTIIISQLINIDILKPIIVLNLLIRTVVGLKQSSTKKIIAYSSISNRPWIITATKFSKFQFIYFFSTYTVLITIIMITIKKNKILYLNQIKTIKAKQKLILLISILSIRGIPPLLGFFPKWIILQTRISRSLIIPIAIIFSSIISTFIYMKIIYPTILNFSINKKININLKEINKTIIINLIGIPLIIILKTN